MKYLLLDVTNTETKLLLVAGDMHSAVAHGHIAKAKGLNVIAPPLEGRSFAKLELLPLQYLYWNTFHEAPSDNYATLLADCKQRFEAIPVDTTPLQELEAEVARLCPNTPETARTSKKSPKAKGGSPSTPKSGSVTGRVWAVADALWQSSGVMPERRAVMAACEAEDINPSTASTQYGKWKASRLLPK